jgi:DNA polymerase-1
LTDAERKVVDFMFERYRSSTFERPAKLSKRSVLESYEAWTASEKERKKAKVLASKRDNVWIVMDEETLGRLEAMLDNEPIVAVDVETTGVDIFVDRIVGVSVTLPNADIDAYVSYGHIDPSDKEAFQAYAAVNGYDAAIEKYRLKSQLSPERVKAFWAKCVTGRQTIGHNIKFDWHQTANVGIEPDPPFWDTMVAMRILNNNEESYRLKDLHAKYVSGDESITFEDLFDDFTIYDKDIVLAGIYAAGDTRKTYDLYRFQRPHMETRDNLKTAWAIEQRLLHIDFKTERNGLHVDFDHLARLRESLVPRLDEAKRKVIEAFSLDAEFNFNSPQQLAHLIYDLAGADPTFPRRFRKNDRSTAADVVDALCADLPQLSPLLEYRMIEKLLTAFVDKIPKAIEPTDGKMHFSLDSTATDTGRYACRGYGNKGNAKGINLQQIPSRTKEGVEVRKAFVPSPGHVFISSDLSQIEPRVIAHYMYTYYGDGAMRQIYLDGLDLYTKMAVEVFGLDEQYCVDKAMDPTGTFEPRRTMKTGVLARLYRQSEKAFARKMNVSEEVAKRFFEGTDRSFPGLEALCRDVIDKLSTRGNVAYAEGLYGNKRRFDKYRKNLAELRKVEAIPYRRMTQAEKDRMWELRRAVSGDERAAINALVQGTAAYILKQNIIALFDLCEKRGWKFVASIHDEVMLEVPLTDVTPETIADIERCMTQTVELSLPLRSDTVIQLRWGAEVKPKDWFAKEVQ